MGDSTDTLKSQRGSVWTSGRREWELPVLRGGGVWVDVLVMGEGRRLDWDGRGVKALA